MARRNGEKKENSVAVAIDKDKSSQHALKWTVDHLLTRGQALTLLHIKQNSSSIPTPCEPPLLRVSLSVIVCRLDLEGNARLYESKHHKLNPSHSSDATIPI